MHQQVACGFLKDDGSRCDCPAVTFVVLAPEVRVPACEDCLAEDAVTVGEL